VFTAGLGQKVFEAYAALWTHPPRVAPGSDRHELSVHACPASLFTTQNRFSNAFPAGYRDVARCLRPDRVWLAWRYSLPGNLSGLAMDGLVHARGNWVWYPKIHAVLGQQIHPR